MYCRYVDVDALFSENHDEDYDTRVAGVSRSAHYDYYARWIQHCVQRRSQAVSNSLHLFWRADRKWCGLFLFRPA